MAASTLLACTLAPDTGWAQGESADSQVKSLIKSASDDYDTLKIPSAKKKLKKAIKLGKNKGASDSVLARAYVMFGIVDFGATKEKKRALKAFKEAAKLDSEASVPKVYKTPTLTKLMKKAHRTTKSPEPESDSGAGPKKEVEEFTHEPISSAKAGEPVQVEAFVPPDLSVGSVSFVYKRYNQQQWNSVELEATNATRFAKEIRGCRIYTTQVSYYIQVTDPSGEVVAESGSESSPHMMTVLGSSGVDTEKLQEECSKPPKGKGKGKGPGKGEGKQDADGDGVADSKDNCPQTANESQTDTDGDGIGDVCDDTPDGGGGGGGGGGQEGSGPVAYLDIGAGSAAGYLPSGLQPTANPTRNVDPGLTAAFAHAQLGGGYMFSSRSQLGLYLRFQFLPYQNFANIRSALAEREDVNKDYRGFRTGPCLGTGLPGDCLLGLKYRYFFSSSSATQFFSSVGAGTGLVRHWLRLREDASEPFCENKEVIKSQNGPDFCYRTDTVRPGWLHFGVGGGMAFKFSETVALLAELYFQVLFPNTAVNLDVNVGPQFRF